MADLKPNTNNQELAQQADLLKRVLPLAKKNYIGAVEQHEKDDAEVILEKLDDADVTTHVSHDAS